MSLRNPVLLIHGLYDTSRKFDVMAAYLESLGWSVHRLSLTPNSGAGCLKNLAQQVNQYVTQTFPPEQPIDLLGFSMGGLVTRYYLQRLGGLKKVQRYISISAPNHGTIMAYSLPLTGIQQMCPYSEFLRDLNQDCRELLSEIKVTVMWTPFDLLIVPPQSSSLGMGTEKVFPVWVHAWMVSDKQILESVAEALSEPI